MGLVIGFLSGIWMLTSGARPRWELASTKHHVCFLTKNRLDSKVIFFQVLTSLFQSTKYSSLSLGLIFGLIKIVRLGELDIAL